MFPDPQTVTVATVAKVMPRVESDGKSATYQLGDQTYTLSISHQQKGSRIRSLAKVTRRAIVADPLTAVNDYQELGVHLVIDRPEYGFSSTDVNDLIVGFKTWLDSTAVGKLYGRES